MVTRTVKLKKKKAGEMGVVAGTHLNPSPQEAETGGLVTNSKPVWSTE